tara:strand:+ start:7889 stop:8878 length:990 start_codon:yes stop_codon:yes gene_type:complete
MRVLVTGAAGFIGSHTCETILKDKRIKKLVGVDHLKDGSLRNLKNIMKNRKFHFKKIDIRDRRLFPKLFKKIDVIIHLAAVSDIVPSIKYPSEYLDVNFNGTLNILENMRRFSVKKIIFSASSSCYGIPKNFPTSEKEKISPKYPYAFSKYISEQLIIHWSNVYKINYLSLRLFNVYGTRSRTNNAYGAAIGVFLRQKIGNKPYTVIGSGKQKRDFINVVDVSSLFKKCIFSKMKNQIYNVGSGKPKSINYLLKLLKGKKIKIPKRPGEPNITHANINKVIKELKWKPKISFESGINEILDHKSYWSKAPLWTKDKIKKVTKDWFKYLR